MNFCLLFISGMVYCQQIYQLGVNPQADIACRQDCRGAQEKYVMQLHDAHLAARMPRHS